MGDKCPPYLNSLPGFPQSTAGQGFPSPLNALQGNKNVNLQFYCKTRSSLFCIFKNSEASMDNCAWPLQVLAWPIPACLGLKVEGGVWKSQDCIPVVFHICRDLPMLKVIWGVHQNLEVSFEMLWTSLWSLPDPSVSGVRQNAKPV